MKITFIGAVSVQFTTAVVQDIATFEALRSSEICLMDINEYRLGKITECVQRIKDELEANFTITPTLDRTEALTGADAVIFD